MSKRLFSCPVCQTPVETPFEAGQLPHPFGDTDENLTFVLEHDLPDWKLPEHLAQDLLAATVPLKDILKYRKVVAFCPASNTPAEQARKIGTALRSGTFMLTFSTIAGTCKASAVPNLPGLPRELLLDKGPSVRKGVR